MELIRGSGRSGIARRSRGCALISVWRVSPQRATRWKYLAHIHTEEHDGRTRNFAALVQNVVAECAQLQAIDSTSRLDARFASHLAFRLQRARRLFASMRRAGNGLMLVGTVLQHVLARMPCDAVLPLFEQHAVRARGPQPSVTAPQRSRAASAAPVLFAPVLTAAQQGTWAVSGPIAKCAQTRSRCCTRCCRHWGRCCACRRGACVDVVAAPTPAARRRASCCWRHCTPCWCCSRRSCTAPTRPSSIPSLATGARVS